MLVRQAKPGDAMDVARCMSAHGRRGIAGVGRSEN
jgi:hypothetical protein